VWLGGEPQESSPPFQGDGPAVAQQVTEAAGDGLHPPHRDAGELHLDQRLRILPPPVAFDDRRLEGLAPQLRVFRLARPTRVSSDRS
jgi:hypothetical protein